MSWTDSAKFYDLIYSTFKDYEAEADQVGALIGVERPGAQRVLDVACGTGEHALHLRERGYLVDGVDLEPNFVRIAAEKNPEGTFLEGDMADFDLGRSYDVVLCLFSSIGYMLTEERLRRALRCFRGHVEDDGVIVVEPWITPETWNPGRISVVQTADDDVTVVRMASSDAGGLTFEYLIGRDGEGITHLTERHDTGFYTVEQMRAAFEAAGLAVTHDPQGLTGRGLYVARRA